MSRLQSEWHRLYQVQAMVLAVGRPADWAATSAVWQGVQADLNLPAPAIAVSGTDGYQLWFSLAEPVPTDQALAFLDGLRARYLGDIAPPRLALIPAVAQDMARPPVQVQADQWSAFVAPDLAPVFADTPWLDIPPNLDGQADLLARLVSIRPDEFERALRQLSAAPLGVAVPVPAVDAPTPAGTWADPKRFLLDVMNDPSVAPGLRIEAAKALLPYFEVPRAQGPA